MAVPSSRATSGGIGSLLGPKLRVVQRTYLIRRGGISGGRHQPVAATAIVDRSVKDLATHPRYIDAEDIHSDLSQTLGEQEFWSAKRDFYRKRIQYYPTWDRQAQTLVKLCRQVPRVPQEAAFRLFAVFLKLLLLPQLASLQGLLLPASALANVEGVIGSAIREKKGPGADHPGETSNTPQAASSQVAQSDEPPKCTRATQDPLWASLPRVLVQELAPRLPLGGMDYIQLVGTDTPDSVGSCCFGGTVHHDAFNPLVHPTVAPSETVRAPSLNNAACEGLLFFNCPEGAQRFASEAQLKLTKVRGFLFTRLSVTAVMGLPGLLFTINDAGVDHMSFAGPPAVCSTTSSPACSVAPTTARMGWAACPAESASAVATPVSAISMGYEARLRRIAFVPSDITFFLWALRKHFFTYRRMTFQEIVPSCSWFPSEPQHTEAPRKTSTVPPSSMQPYLRGAVDASCSSLMDQGFVESLWENGSECVGAGEASPTGSAPYSANMNTVVALPPLPERRVTPLHPPSAPTAGSLVAPREPFFVFALRLSTHCVLVAFRTSGRCHSSSGTTCKEPSSGAGRHSLAASGGCKRKRLADGALEEGVPQPPTTRSSSPIGGCCVVEPHAAVLSYALIHAPPSSFDPALARALGVRPGPKYGLLKQGQRVVTDAPTTQSGSSEPRYVYPHQVARQTPASQSLFITLVLDCDHPEDLRDTLEQLLGREDGHSAAGGGEPDSSWKPAATDGDVGELLHFVRRMEPEWEFCDDSPAAMVSPGPPGPVAPDGGADTPVMCRRRRSTRLRTVIHLQRESFFLEHFSRGADEESPSAAALVDRLAVGSAYLTSVFGGVRSVFRSQALASVTLRPAVVTTSGPGALDASIPPPEAATRTSHIYSYEAYSAFSAFPTAKAHRHHLNFLAPAFFPQAERADAASATSSAAESGSSSGSPATPPIWPYSVKHRIAHVQPVSLAPQEVCNPEATADFIRYPTAVTATQLLSDSFRVAAETFHEASEPKDRAAATGETGSHAPVDTPLAVGLSDGIVFLGTGSAVPSKYRNVSGAVLSLTSGASPGAGNAAELRGSKRRFVVLDFGEGSLGQLKLLFESHGPVTDGWLPAPQSSCGAWRRVGSCVSPCLQLFVKELSFVFISHHHADHHLGLMALLELRHRLLEGHDGHRLTPLLVVCPDRVKQFLVEAFGRHTSCCDWLATEVLFDTFSTPSTFFSRISAGVADEDFSEAYPSSRNLMGGHMDRFTAPHETSRIELLGQLQQFIPSLPLLHEHCRRENWDICVCPVVHPADAHAMMVRTPLVPDASGRSASHHMRTVVFSGDTRPSVYLVHTVRAFMSGSLSGWNRAAPHGDCEPTSPFSGSSLPVPAKPLEELILIHEATFGDGYESEATQKQHSTLAEAVCVAKAMGAAFLVLNHFSQRYPKLPGLTNDGSRGPVTRTHSTPECTSMKSSPSSSATASEIPFSFAFDLMFQPFHLLHALPRYTPLFTALLEEYESWGVGTTRRLRGIEGPSGKSKVSKQPTH